MWKRRSLRLAAAGLATILAAAPGAAAELTTTEAWREDLAAMQDLITGNHPDPFGNISREEFEAAVAGLHERIPELDEKAIIVELAAIVALVGDGHTRLALPRQHPALALSLAHSGDPPVHESLRFASLPLRFALFDDGLFITATTADYEALLGARVDTVGGMPVGEAIGAVAAISYADNAQGHKVMAADRLSLPEALYHLGISEHPERLVLGLTLSDGRTAMRDIPGLREAASGVLQRPPGTEDVLWWARRNENAFSVPLADGAALYLQLNEITAPAGQQFADVIARAIDEAQRQEADRLVLDLRHNHGGNGSWNAAIIDGISRSRWNDYGSLYVLIGRRTFSAAQSLLGELERYTDVIFVGEDSGSAPTHFGDPVKVQLPNSGLTLRVSAIRWRSWLAGEFRESTSPHLAVAYRSADYLYGRDPVLRAALDHTAPADIAAQTEELLREGNVQGAAIRFLRYHTDTTVYPHDSVEEVVAAGHRLLDEGRVREGFYMMVLAVDFYPGSATAEAGLSRAREMREN
jgi:hypothetical protein